MKKILLITFVILMLKANLVFAHEHSFDETKQLIDSGISCDKLTDEQLEDIGEYYMEQMHPGEAHEMMDKMMGGEDSDSLKQMHIQMAKRLYCNENIGGMMGSGGGMMGMMPMMGMMSGNSNLINTNTNSMMNPIYFGAGGWFGWIFMILFWILVIAAIIALIRWIINQGENKSKSESALEILQKRYARGEIDKKEFEEKKKNLI